MPPRAAQSASRRAHASTWVREGATPDTPMNGARRECGPGGARGGGPAVRDGPVDEERRRHEVAEDSPRPGMIAAECPWLRRDLAELDLQEITRDGRPSRTRARSRGGWRRPGGSPDPATVERDVRCPSHASRVSSATSSPSPTSTIGSMSGCQRLWPVRGSSASGFRRSIEIVFVMVVTPSPLQPADADALDDAAVGDEEHEQAAGGR